jgi:hypothetical protein
LTQFLQVEVEGFGIAQRPAEAICSKFDVAVTSKVTL